MNDTDWEIFKDSVKPIKKKTKLKQAKKKLTPKFNFSQKKENNPDLDHIVTNNWGVLEKNIHRKILRNQIKISNRLDLHGSSVEESKSKVCDFITNSYKNQYRLVLIICGKGKRLEVSEGWKGTGILNKKVPDWLNSKALNKKIVWFDYAQPENGGKGAYLIYLKKSKNELC